MWGNAPEINGRRGQVWYTNFVVRLMKCVHQIEEFTDRRKAVQPSLLIRASHACVP